MNDATATEARVPVAVSDALNGVARGRLISELPQLLFKHNDGMGGESTVKLL